MKLREQAYNSFTENLLSRKILPGQFITQKELSAVTSMPLGAIRELIPRLEADGLLATVPQRGMQITHIDVNLIRDAFQLRYILEMEAVVQFALNATNEERAEIEQSHRGILDEAKNGITDALVEKAQRVDWGFHEALIDHMQNKIISDIYRVNSIKIRLIRQELSRIQPEIVLSVIGVHLEIIKHLNAKDSEKATAALSEHIKMSEKRALRI
ncbi:MAG: GntR family transcriptional regulator [Rhizobiaceae bacterium]